MFLVGVLGNGSLGFALCCGPGARSRSPLLLGLITADLLVCSLSGPVTAALYTLTSWTQTWYHAALFVQVHLYQIHYVDGPGKLCNCIYGDVKLNPELRLN